MRAQQQVTYEAKFAELERERGALLMLEHLIAQEQGQRAPLSVVKGEDSDAQEEDATDEGQTG